MNKILKLGLTVCLFAIPAKFAVAKDLQLLNLNNADKQVCYQSQMLPKVIETQRYITRYKYPYKEGNFELYLDGLIRQINWYAGQLASDKKSLSFTIGLENMKKNLITAAEKNAWTRLDWTGKGASPAFATSLLVRSISYTYAILDSEGQLSNKEKDLLNKWVTKMIPNTTKKVNTLDTELNSYNALMSWGAVTQNYRCIIKENLNFTNGLKIKFVLIALLQEEYDTTTKLHINL